MKNTLLSTLIIACAFSPLAGAAELPKAGTYSAGAQISFGSADHDRFNSGKDGVAQATFYLDYYFTAGWALEVGINGGSNVQDWICENVDAEDIDDDYCTNTDSDASDPNTFENELEYSNLILALRFDRQVSENSFVYGKLGAQYFDYEMSDNDNVFEQDTGTGIYSELGWKYEWSNNISANVGYQYIGMSDLSTSSLTMGVGYRF